MKTRAAVLMVSLLVVMIVAGACSEDSEVGSGVKTEGLGGKQGALRDTTTVPPETTAPPDTSLSTTAPPRTTAPPQTTAPPTTTKSDAVFEVKIQSDQSSGQFEPRLAQVRRGTVVRWINTDTVARSIEADNAAFRSPEIPPGGAWDYKASTPGSFNYHDGTRPYAVATLQVA